MIFNNPSNHRTFCSRRSCRSPRRMSVQPAERAARNPRPAVEKHSERAELQGQVVLARKDSPKFQGKRIQRRALLESPRIQFEHRTACILANCD